MSDDAFCRKHSCGPSDEEWKVAIEELTSEESDDDVIEPFREQVCPLCFIAMRERFRKARRQLKIESRQNIRLRRDNDELQAIVDVTIATIKGITGKDPEKLAKKEYKKKTGQNTGIPFTEHGDLKNILPNLIAEAAHSGRKPEEGGHGA